MPRVCNEAMSGRSLEYFTIPTIANEDTFGSAKRVIGALSHEPKIQRILTEVASHDTRLVGLDSSKARRPKARRREIAETRLIFASSVFGAKFALRESGGRKAHQTALELRYIQFPRPFRRPTLAQSPQ